MSSIKQWVGENIGWIEICRESKLNALNYDALTDLESAVEKMRSDPAVRCIVITGKGERAFCAGADIEYYVDIHPLRALDFMRYAQRVLNRIENSPKPVIAAVNGYALGGGCELSLSCDLRVASDNAQFAVPEVNLGLFPGWGGTQRLPRIVGLAFAKHMILTGEPVSAHRAEQLGMVSCVVPLPNLREKALALALHLADKSPKALALAKQSIHLSLEVDLQSGLQSEAANLALVYSGNDSQEGISAFLEKRKPMFTGE